MFVFYLLSIVHLTSSQNFIAPLRFSDCTHLVLPNRCQCYHSGNESQLNCCSIQLNFLPKLPNNMHWYALDFSSNRIKSIDSHAFSDIHVEKLDLRSNYLQTVDLTAFNRIQDLKQLFIDHNQLKAFNPRVLTSPGVSLEIFDISHNPLGYLDLGEIFLHSPVLKEFYAISCQLSNSSLFTLLKLNRRHYTIKLIDLSYNNLTSLCNNLFDNFYNLIELRLNNNNVHLIDNYFISSLNYIRTLNLAFNSIEYIPNLFSSSLEKLNFSSNNIRYLHDYFASNLRSIRSIDFDSNKYLTSLSTRSFCFINILTLKKLSFRFNNISSLNTFSELLCRLADSNHYQSILDLNHNINLKCNCMLTHFQKYLTDYFNLTCTQHGQDRYFISKLTEMFSNCTWNYCTKQKGLCQWPNAEQLILEGTCQHKLIDEENSISNELGFINMRNHSQSWEYSGYNSTLSYDKEQAPIAVATKKIRLHLFFLYSFIIMVL